VVLREARPPACSYDKTVSSFIYETSAKTFRFNDASINAEAFDRRAGYEIVERGVHRLRSGHEMACLKMKKSRTREMTNPHPRAVV
jgi:hypothetical protein